MNTTNKKTIFVIDDALGSSTRNQFNFMANTLISVFGIDKIDVLPNQEKVTFNKFKERHGDIISDRVGLIRSIQRVLNNPNSEIDTFKEIKEYFSSKNIDGFCIDYKLISEDSRKQTCNALNFFKHFIKNGEFTKLPLLFYSSQFDGDDDEFKVLKVEVENSNVKFNQLYLTQDIVSKTMRTQNKLMEVFSNAPTADTNESDYGLTSEKVV